MFVLGVVVLSEHPPPESLSEESALDPLSSFSTTHVLLHPSPSTRFPSSHFSPRSRLPSPQEEIAGSSPGSGGAPGGGTPATGSGASGSGISATWLFCTARIRFSGSQRFPVPF